MPPGTWLPGSFIDRLEVAEEQRDALRRVIGVWLHGARADTRAAATRMPSRSSDARLRVAGPGRQRLRRPSARSKLRMVRLATAYTICWWNCGVPFARRQPALRQHVRIVEIDRFVEAAARRIDVDDLEVLADRSAVQRLPRHLERDLADRRRFQRGGETWVDGYSRGACGTLGATG